MKKSFLLVLTIHIFLVAKAQITVTSADMPAVGDTVRTSVAFNSESFDFAATGDGFTWDFSGLNPVSQRVDTFYAVTSTPVVFWPFFLTSADLVNTFNPAAILPGLPEALAYRFLESSNSRYQDLGYGLIFEGTPIPLKYSDADEIYQFPMNYGQSYADDATLELALPDVGYVLIERSRENTIDGWGTLTTPFGTFETLRYKSEVEEYDSLFINGSGQAIQRNYTEYHWLAQGMKVPLLQVTIDETAGNMVMYQDSARVINVGLFENQREATTLKIMPNPVYHQARLQFNAEKATSAELIIFDLHGKLVLSQSIDVHQGANEVLIETDQYFEQSGLYSVQITGKEVYFYGKMLLLE